MYEQYVKFMLYIFDTFNGYKIYCAWECALSRSLTRWCQYIAVTLSVPNYADDEDDDLECASEALGKKLERSACS